MLQNITATWVTSMFINFTFVCTEQQMYVCMSFVIFDNWAL